MTWSYFELCQLLRSVEFEEYQRGGMGQNVHTVVWPPAIDSQAALEEVALRALVEAAWPALMMITENTGEAALDLYDRLVPKSYGLRTTIPLLNFVRFSLTTAMRRCTELGGPST
jgi:hypothetical protein